MTTTIVPSSGAGALFTQQGVGTTPGYSALDERRSNSGGLQEGVLNGTDFMVVQRGAGANMSVDIGMPAGGFAYVQGDTVSGQGLYCVSVHSATINEAIAAADATNPRIDQIILEIQDNVLDASGGNLARTRVLTGTPNAAATLDNRAVSAAALPGSALLLADVLVGAAVSTIPNNKIRDRRKWARGAYTRITRTAGDYTTTSGSFALVDSTNLQPRIECSGAPVRATIRGTVWHSTGGAAVDFDLGLDGANQSLRTQVGNTGYPASQRLPVGLPLTALPSAGSHLVGPMWLTGAATATLLANASYVLEFTVEELVRQNTANNTVTSG